MSAPISTISPKALHDLPRPLRIVDVRTPAEHRHARIAESTSVPHDQLVSHPFPPNEPVYLICRKGNLSLESAEKLAAARPDLPVFVVEGGLFAWRDAGLPLYRRGSRTTRYYFHRACLAGVGVSAVLSIVIHRGLLGIGGLVGAILAAEMTWHNFVNRDG